MIICYMMFKSPSSKAASEWETTFLGSKLASFHWKFHPIQASWSCWRLLRPDSRYRGVSQTPDKPTMTSAESWPLNLTGVTSSPRHFHSLPPVLSWIFPWTIILEHLDLTEVSLSPLSHFLGFFVTTDSFILGNFPVFTFSTHFAKSDMLPAQGLGRHSLVFLWTHPRNSCLIPSLGEKAGGASKHTSTCTSGRRTGGQAAAHGGEKSQTQLSDGTTTNLLKSPFTPCRSTNLLVVFSSSFTLSSVPFWTIIYIVILPLSHF